MTTTTSISYTISDIKRINKEKGLTFFSKKNMDLFKSKVEREVYQGPHGVYFITSERVFYDYSIPRKYSVRRFDPETGQINTMDEYRSFTYLLDAKNKAMRYAYYL